ncbi:MAG: hypothetical protein ACI4SF_15615 [Oscillospiraceae bacterium]
MRYFTCPKCGNNTLCSTENEIDFHTLCVCEECAAELYSEPQYDGSVKFVEMSAEELEEEHYNRMMNMSYKNRAKAV